MTQVTPSTTTPAPAQALSAQERQAADTAALGRLLRNIRQSRGMSLKDFAARAGMSEGLISQFERGKGNPSLLTLQKLADVLELQLFELFHRVGNGAHDGSGSSLTPAQCAVVRHDARKKLILPHEGLVYELLTPDLQRKLAVLRCEVPAGFDSGARPFQHEGEECVHVLEGTLRAHVAEDVHDLGPGDSITYQSSLPHWWRNTGSTPTYVICSATPPSF